MKTTRTRRTVDGSTITSSAQPSMSQDHQAHGLYALTPLALSILMAVTGLAFWIFTNLQISSTEQAVFGLLQQTVHVDPSMTQAQVTALLNGGALEKNQQIAAAIGWGVQIALLLFAFPPDYALLLVHRNNTIDPSPSLARVADRYNKVRKVLTWCLVAAEILTDFAYVVSGHDITVMRGILPQISASGWGVLLVGLMYPATICFVTVFVGKYMIAFAHALFQKLLDMGRAALA